MREIKFKVWDKDLKKIVSSYVANVRLELETGRIYYNGTDMSEFYELLQYTGLKDNLQNEIYEGDIVKTIGKNGYTIFEINSIEWSNDSASFTFGSFCNIPIALNFHGGGCEVVGNIYENPEILK